MNFENFSYCLRRRIACIPVEQKKKGRKRKNLDINRSENENPAFFSFSIIPDLKSDIKNIKCKNGDNDGKKDDNNDDINPLLLHAKNSGKMTEEEEEEEEEEISRKEEDAGKDSSSSYSEHRTIETEEHFPSTYSLLFEKQDQTNPIKNLVPQPSPPSPHTTPLSHSSRQPIQLASRGFFPNDNRSVNNTNSIKQHFARSKKKEEEYEIKEKQQQQQQQIQHQRNRAPINQKITSNLVFPSTSSSSSSFSLSSTPSSTSTQPMNAKNDSIGAIKYERSSDQLAEFSLSFLSLEKNLESQIRNISEEFAQDGDAAIELEAAAVIENDFYLFQEQKHQASNNNNNNNNDNKNKNYNDDDDANRRSYPPSLSPSPFTSRRGIITCVATTEYDDLRIVRADEYAKVFF